MPPFRPATARKPRSIAFAASMLFLGKCGPSGCEPVITPPSPAPVVAPAPALPVAAPAPALPVAAPAPAPPAASLDVAAFIVGGGPIPPSSEAEPSGNFRTICTASHLAYDDPIVKPGQAGGSHLHLFFGNATTDASSTYESLRAAGNSSCQGGPANRSAYWVPALHNASGDVLVPDYITVYYKGNGPTASAISRISAPPAGLKMIAGYDMAAPTATSRFHWMCENGQGLGGTIPSCPSGVRVGAVLEFPSCWDGRNLDSPDHRSHMAYLTWAGGNGAHCPDTHPVMLPQYTMGVWYGQTEGTTGWYLSSDRSMGAAAAPGSTFHGDWFGAWDPAVQTTWTTKCINEMRNCINGQLGDGSMLAGDWTRYQGPSVVAEPVRPV